MVVPDDDDDFRLRPGWIVGFPSRNGCRMYVFGWFWRGLSCN